MNSASTQDSRALREQAIKNMWLSDIAGWRTKMEQATTHTERMWFHSLHQRAVDIYEAELLKLRFPSLNITYPMTHWKRDDEEAANAYHQSIQQSDTDDDESSQDDNSSTHTD